MPNILLILAAQEAISDLLREAVLRRLHAPEHSILKYEINCVRM